MSSRDCNTKSPTTSSLNLNYFLADENIFSLFHLSNRDTNTQCCASCNSGLSNLKVCLRHEDLLRIHIGATKKEIKQRAMATRAQSEKMHSLHRRRTCAQLTTTECWICYQDEVDKSECLRRDCLCRDPDALALSASRRKNIEWDERDPDGSMSQLPPTLSEYAQI